MMHKHNSTTTSKL